MAPSSFTACPLFLARIVLAPVMVRPDPSNLFGRRLRAAQAGFPGSRVGWAEVELRGSVRIATIRGIEIGVHYSWVLVFLLVAWTLAVGLFPFQYPGLSTGIYWAMGFVASFLLFVSVLIHELAHSFVAQARGLGVNSITLFIFGGVSNIAREPSNAPDELLISAVGPISSVVLGAVFYGIWIGLGDGGGAVAGVAFYLAFINVLLAVFNLIPGFPLDGGRVFRAIIWWATGSFRTATRIAVTAGQAVAFLFVIAGIFIVFTGAFLSGIWLVLIGWFLYSAAGASARETQREAWLQGVTVRQVMNQTPTTVEPELPVSELVHREILQKAIRALPVVRDGLLVGMVTLNEVRGVPRERWEETPVGAVMTPREQLQTVKPDDDLAVAIRILAEQDVNQLPVVEDSRLVGLLSRSNVMRFLQVREELGMAEEEERRAA